MRLRRVRMVDGRHGVAVLWEDRWVPLPAAFQHRPPTEKLRGAARSVVAFLEGGTAMLDEASEILSTVAGEDFTGSFDAAPLLPFRPVSFRDFALWERHMIDAARGLARFGPQAARRTAAVYERRTGRIFPRFKPAALWYERPIYYKGSSTCFIGDGEEVPWPPYTQALDYELEIGVIIARPVLDATPDQARAAVGGFVVVNDFSARDVQLREMTEGRFGPAKSKDFANGMGPVVVTADELPDHPLAAEVRVNGETWGSGNTSGMQHSIADMVAYASAGERLVPGELLATGTIPGCSGVETDRWLSPGDTVELKIEGIGTLSNVVGRPRPHLQSGQLSRAPWTCVPRGGHGPDAPLPDPAAWTPPPAPSLEGILAPNGALDGVERWETGGGQKPEDIAFDGDGRVYCGVEDGRIFRFPPAGGPPEVFADTHGRPLGLEFDAGERLVVCDADRGLLRIDPTGRTEILVDAWEGRHLKFTNNAAVAADGTIYFSDSSTHYGIAHYRWDLIEHRPNGRLFAHHPGTGETALLMDDLYFANGVALPADESFVLVSETGKYRITRLWLNGPRAGRRDVFADNLPGFPDNLSRGSVGGFWAALTSPRRPQLDAILPRPAARRAMVRLPERLQPQPVRYGLVLQLDDDGEVIRSLHGPSGSFSHLTAAEEHHGFLYLGSLVETAIGRVPVAR